MEEHRGTHAPAVHEGAVGALQIREQVPAALAVDAGVATRHPLALDVEIGLDVAANLQTMDRQGSRGYRAIVRNLDQVRAHRVQPSAGVADRDVDLRRRLGRDPIH